MFNTDLQNLNLDEILKDLISVKERRFFNIVPADILTKESTLKLPIKLDQQCFDFMFK
tara:strand:- start:230 stop:403 length:174 start_codon:yes stop_codon:yes gene_type:complete